RAVLQRAQERLEGRVEPLAQRDQRRRLRGGGGQTRGLGVEVDGRRARRGRNRAGHDERRREQRDERYDFSDSHIRFPPTMSKLPLPPLDQSQPRPGYVTSLHGAGRTQSFVFHTTSNWPSSRILPM